MEQDIAALFEMEAYHAEEDDEEDDEPETLEELED